ncbi:aspartic peptidase domain-containing protein [Cristinia sonorae]|uniref:Aspartic peptidase domain-containing protein n=1 Tax=Cristinia sonorae TaxID=1940300 RepID=A0A8K0XMC6_9AGAR|nr:aspartic peptidase domain-containing protein [Cristinia sonorae]
MKISSLPSSLSLVVYAWIATSTADALTITPHHPPAAQQIGIVRRSKQRMTAEEFSEWSENKLAGLALKYGGGSSSEKRAVGVNLLVNQQFDSSYFGTVAVGTPPISYSVILDTGSADMWIATTSSNQSQSSSGIPLFNPSTSTTFKDSNEPFQVNYGSGSVSGTLGTDKVQFAGFEVQAQEFGQVHQTTSQLLTSPVSGLMGLGFQGIASSGALPFWQAIVKSNQLDSPLMSFQLTRMNNASNARSLEFGGTFTLGAVNNTLFTGDIDYQNIPDGAPGYWILPLSGLSAEGKNVDVPSGTAAWAAIDTGTTGVAGPANVIAQLYAAIPGSRPLQGSQNFWSIPCDTDYKVTMRFGSSSINWPISSADMRQQQLDDNTCVGGFFSLPSTGMGRTPSWIVGDTFLKNVYSVFRSSPPSVGFAALSATAVSLSDPNLPVPSATLAPSPNSVGGGNNGGGGKNNSGVMSLATASAGVVTIVSVLFGAVIALL